VTEGSRKDVEQRMAEPSLLPPEKGLTDRRNGRACRESRYGGSLIMGRQGKKFGKGEWMEGEVSF